MRYAVLVLLAVLIPHSSLAQFGIGVSPAILELTSQEFPVSSVLFVKNGSETPQILEVLFSGPFSDRITLTPSKVALGAGQTAKVLVEADGALEGKLSVVSVRQTPEGLNTGAGIEVPLRVVVKRPFSSYLTASLQNLPLPSSFVLSLALTAFFLLRVLVFFVKEEKRKVSRGELYPGSTVSFQ